MHQIRHPTNSGPIDPQAARSTMQRFDSFAYIKADEYRYWDLGPMHERLTAICEFSIDGYRLTGILPRVSGLRRPSNLPQR